MTGQHNTPHGPTRVPDRGHQWFKLLAESAGYLLIADNPRTLVQTLVAQLAPHLQIDVCFHYLVEDGTPLMRLCFSQGVPDEIAQALGSLEFEHALCHRVVFDERPLVLEDIVQSEHHDVELLRCLGMTAYVCYPLLAYGGLLGMLGFGSRTRRRFESDELELLQTISFQVAVAMERLRIIAMLQQRNTALQSEVAERHRVETVLRESELTLRDREQRFRTLASHAPVGIFQTDAAGDYVFVNEAWCAMTGLSLEDAQGQGWARALHPDDRERVFREWHDAVKTDSRFVSEYRFQTPQGRVTWVEGTGVALRDEAGRITGYLGTVNDITERKHSEDRIKSSLFEKEVLLKEIHHRVKNNMQIISSLLSLQSSAIHDDRDADLFRESQGRIRSMALVHEKLYRTPDLAHVEMRSYILSLADQLMRSYGSDVVVDVETDGIVLGVDIAIPCGLILNELVVNALKHAFPDGRKGRVRIVLSQQGDDSCRLVVQDNGVGLPSDVDPSTTGSLGLGLVQALTEQLQGTVEINRTEGTTFTVCFSATKTQRT